MSRTVRRIVLFVAGLLLIITGLVLVVLPGPLTIPPILLGVWLWSLEFEFARHWLAPLQRRGSQALDAAREKPVHTAAISLLGLVGAVLVIWAVLRYDLLRHATSWVGLS